MDLFKHSYESLFGIERKCEIEIIIENDDHDGIPVVIAPGFLTEGDDDWLKYFKERIDAPLIYVKWRSSSTFKLTASILTKSLVTLSLPGINATKIITTGIGFFSDWSNAAKEASLAGKDLSRILNDIWDDDDKAIFIGHSLGVRVITEAMRTLSHDNVLTSIAIAGAINKDDYDARISAIKTKGKVQHSNFYSDNDSILTWLYRIGEFNFQKLPIGLVCSDLENVKNYKTHFGHNEYREKNIISKTIVKLYNNAVESLPK
ncbi:DUF726 domain-containing protein [Kosakonia radicincitans]|uniref:DUF726 domain-containing protein n=1 Tax=Kosakonia radicincitans TaxID=283686 RepID=UPI002368CADB|nr:DUF726 domain-containing protein [Kosakonia radicincitans]MDD7993764.1 DUF726 domain-containing protein [Kosakonia radicincitans]